MRRRRRSLRRPGTSCWPVATQCTMVEPTLLHCNPCVLQCMPSTHPLTDCSHLPGTARAALSAASPTASGSLRLDSLALTCVVHQCTLVRSGQYGACNRTPVMVIPAGLDRFDVADDPSRPSPSPNRWPNSTYFRWFPVGSPLPHLHWEWV